MNFNKYYVIDDFHSEIVRVRTPSPPPRLAEASESEDAATVVPSSPFRPRHLAPHQAYDERPLPAMKR